MNETFSVVPKETNDFIDAVESKMINELADGVNYEPIQREHKDIFTDGLYGRKLTMYPGDRITSRIHKTEHQFVILKGKAIVFQDGEEVLLEAGHNGITKAGTRRILLIPEDSTENCVWMTFHPNPDNENVEQIAERIIEKHDNPLLTDETKKEINY